MAIDPKQTMKLHKSKSFKNLDSWGQLELTVECQFYWEVHRRIVPLILSLKTLTELFSPC